jgi:hypothetical protein
MNFIKGDPSLAVIIDAIFDVRGGQKLRLADFAGVGTAVAAAQQPATTIAARAEVLSAIPSNATTVTNYYKQNVYDPSESKIGEIVDVLVSNRGTIDAFIVSVGGFLGIDSKDVVAVVIVACVYIGREVLVPMTLAIMASCSPPRLIFCSAGMFRELWPSLGSFCSPLPAYSAWAD